jgi:hypothetical protein
MLRAWPCYRSLSDPIAITLQMSARGFESSVHWLIEALANTRLRSVFYYVSLHMGMYNYVYVFAINAI